MLKPMFLLAAFASFVVPVTAGAATAIVDTRTSTTVNSPEGTFDAADWSKVDRARGPDVSRVTPDKIDLAPAVPEPATWAMLVLGFGLIGLIARRSRKTSGLVIQG